MILYCPGVVVLCSSRWEGFHIFTLIVACASKSIHSQMGQISFALISTRMTSSTFQPSDKRRRKPNEYSACCHRCTDTSRDRMYSPDNFGFRLDHRTELEVFITSLATDNVLRLSRPTSLLNFVLCSLIVQPPLAQLPINSIIFMFNFTVMAHPNNLYLGCPRFLPITHYM